MNLKILLRGGARVSALLALAILALAAGCNKGPNTGNNPESANSNKEQASAPANASSPVSTPSAADTPSATRKPAGLSPTEVVRSYYEAGVRKDIAGVKRFLSRGSLRVLEDIAKREGKTLEQLFEEAARKDAAKPRPVLSNERIVGNTAVVDIKPANQPLLTMPLIKEDGEWKLAFGVPKSGATK